MQNGQGKQVAVVHQYDRRRDLQTAYFNEYIFWDHQSEAAAMCARFTIEEDVELFKARCDMRVTSGHSNAACCEKCLNTPNCKGWSAAGSQCFLKNCNNVGSANRIAMRGVASGYLTS